MGERHLGESNRSIADEDKRRQDSVSDQEG